MPITKLQFNDAGPFEEISFEFDERVNVFTGANNSGKTTVLLVLAELLVYPFAMPIQLLRSDSSKWGLDYSSATGVESVEGKLPSNPNPLIHTYETIGYTGFLPAQRQSTNFRSPGPAVGQDIDSRIEQEIDLLMPAYPEAFRLAGTEAIRRHLRESRGLDHPELAKRRKLMLTGTSLISDRAVVQKIINLDYAAYRLEQPEIRDVVDQVASIASEITEGFPIELLGVAEDEGGLFPKLGTPYGILPLNVLSQGTQSIVQCLAHLLFGYAEYYGFASGFEKMPGIMIIDEIDAHLHPSWQRRVIPALTSHFPNLQIFCSTHSPLMLAGLKAGQVQLLRRDDADGRMTVSTNESDISGWTADQILRNFLGLPNPTDLDTAMHVIRLQELRRKEELSHEEAEELETLRHTVNQELISGPIAARSEMQDILRRAINESPETSEPPSSETKEEDSSDALG